MDEEKKSNAASKADMLELRELVLEHIKNGTVYIDYDEDLNGTVRLVNREHAKAEPGLEVLLNFIFKSSLDHYK